MTCLKSIVIFCFQDEIIDKIELKAIFGLRPSQLRQIIPILLLQLIIKTHKREEEKLFSEHILVMCLFDMLKKVVESGEGRDVVFEIKNEMAKRHSARFEIKQISKIREIAYQLSDPYLLNQVLETLTCQQAIPLVNWPKLSTVISATGIMAFLITLRWPFKVLIYVVLCPYRGIIL